MPSNQIFIQEANGSFKNAVISLLQSEGLPTGDLDPNLRHFYLALDQNVLVGVAAIEYYAGCALLRSLAVVPQYRNHKIAGLLILRSENEAKANGIEELYLLTETAAEYFEKNGYSRIERTEVPETIKLSSQFSQLCPISAVVMRKMIS